jgi:hypothetical protein
MKPLLSMLIAIGALSSFINISAAHADGAPQLVLKQDFERIDSVAAWRNQTPPASVLAQDNKPHQSHAGSGALQYKISAKSEKELYIYSGVKLPVDESSNGRMVRIRFYARTAQVKNTAFSFRVLERNEKSPTGWLEDKTDTVKIAPSTDWKECSVTGKLAAATRGLTIYIVALNPQPGQTIWLDDLSVEIIPVTP